MEVYFKKEDSIIKMSDILEVQKNKNGYFLTTSSLDRHDTITLLYFEEKEKADNALNKIFEIMNILIDKRQTAVIIMIGEEKIEDGNN